MKKTLFLITAIAITLLIACTDDIITEDVYNDIPVVEAFLRPGQAISLELSRMLPFATDEYTGSLSIDTAQVYINYNGISYLLTPVSDEAGKYQNLDSNLNVVSGGEYTLSFNYNGTTISSSTSIPSKPVDVALKSTALLIDPTIVGPDATVEPASVSWENPNNEYHLIVLEYLESSYDPISDNLSSDSYDQFLKVSTDPVQENSLDLDTRQHILFFGSYRIIVYKINQEYVNLYENISQSSLNFAEPLTNIENGAGIFTGINSDTLYLEVKEI